MKRLKFSIILPCYNVAGFLFDNFKSLLNQDMVLGKDYEIIYIDDLSTDNTVEVLESFIREGVRVFQNEKNIGVSATRNKGIELAEGELLWFVDSDDFIKPNILGKIWKEYKDAQTAIGVNIYAGAVSFDSSPNSICRTTNFGFNINAYNHIASREYIILNQIRFPLGINEGEDQLFVFLLKFFGGKFCDIKDIIYYYRMNPTSLSHTSNPEKHMANMIAMLDFYHNFKILNEGIGSKMALANLNERMQWTAANICSDAIYLDRQGCAETLKELKQKGYYPFPFLWRRLTLKYGIKVLLLNLWRLPLCYPWYYGLMNRLVGQK